MSEGSGRLEVSWYERILGYLKVRGLAFIRGKLFNLVIKKYLVKFLAGPLGGLKLFLVKIGLGWVWRKAEPYLSYVARRAKTWVTGFFYRKRAKRVKDASSDDAIDSSFDDLP